MSAFTNDLETGVPLRSRNGRLMWGGVIGLAMLGVPIAAMLLSRDPQTAVAAPPLPVVSVAPPLSRTVNEWDAYVGRFAPSKSVDVRPRVSGQVIALHFADGAIVKQGQLLFTIDKRPFEAALGEAQAMLESAKSDLALARTDVARADQLSDAAISKSEVDRRRAKMQAAVASVAAAEARVQSRALDMEFTDVRAPIAGRASDRRVDPGNLVMAGDGANSTLLTTINALDPIYFNFDTSEAIFLKTKRAQQSGAEPSRVEVRLQDETNYRWSGQLDFIDTGLDPRSGTIRTRAVLMNPDMFLTPGMFGNMRLANGTASTALLVPDFAIQTDQARKTVLTVASDGKVIAKPVQLGAVVDGLRIVKSGLNADDLVIVGGIISAVPGANVATKAGEIVPVTSSPRTPMLATSGEVTFAR
ncbi:efflux RND transporter periplasmic adaptor subunit [Tardiphaga sp. 862_B3_N4_1]|uniref:efflux RND transporter periplasmic adaptor subunit n=1 Tax=Tardiphaga sp. 862_B3_N4_1 TaxID=3240764 RepID=UPI003F1EFB47